MDQGKGEIMTTWDNYREVIFLQNLCAEKGLVISETRDAVKIGVDSERFPAFTKDNSLYYAENVTVAIAWVQGFFSDFWRKSMMDVK